MKIKNCLLMRQCAGKISWREQNASLFLVLLSNSRVASASKAKLLL